MVKRLRLLLMMTILLLSGILAVANPDGLPNPESVTIAGTVQSLLGCAGDWDPACESTFLTYEEANDIWRASFDLPAGSYEYKAALNGSWDANYGLGAAAGGPNIPLELAADQTVMFLYDHKTGWITDNVNSVVATAPGSFQDELGCGGDWQPDCLRSWLQDPDGDGVYTFTTNALPAGDFEVKVAINESWDVNFGAEGEPGGANIPFTVPSDGAEISFSYNTADNLLTISVSAEPVTTVEAGPAEPAIVKADLVNIPGTLQTALGCPAPWDPACEATLLTYDEATDIWSGTFDLPAGEYEYKVAINGSWGENYGGFADKDGPNIPLALTEDTTISFFYDHKTHWIADDVRHDIFTIPGSFQDELGCPAEWDPACMASWLQDPKASGTYTFSTNKLPAGDYEAKVAVNRSWDENYGANGEAGGANIAFTVDEDGANVTFIFDPATKALVIISGGSAVTPAQLRESRAYWLDRDTLAWNIAPAEGESYALLYSADGSLNLSPFGLEGVYESVALTVDEAGLSEDILAKFPHLAGYTAFSIGEDDLGKVPDMLKSETAFAVFDAKENLSNITGIQIPGVLDDLYTYDGPLGISINEGVPTIRVWAPTAQSVRFHLFADSGTRTDASSITEMSFDAETGVWSIEGAADWLNQFYLFEVQVYAPTTGLIENNIVTDPYSVSMAINSTRSQIIDLNDPALMPDGWNDLVKEGVGAAEEITVYELHVRDFSVFDETVPEELRGTYMAFTVNESDGMKHLKALADAGLSHLHLLPTFDIATINENRRRHFEPDYDAFASLTADSDQQQAEINTIRDLDGFNWGYDPFHYNTPEGSYSTDADGPQRILEYRQMVQNLAANGLYIVADVVYNHTNASGQGSKSVLDKVVPGYYHRLDATGVVARSTCCDNTASEHNMMRKLMVDSVVLWATAYKIDAFRFDLMGHHMKADMLAVREALDALTIEEHGVDGQRIYLYGEGWNFGEVADNQRGVNATQFNLGGTEIGTFNDRLRDAVRGGSPFGGRPNQGFISDLGILPNGLTEGTEEAQQAQMLLFADQIRVGLAGNLRDYSFTGASGEAVTGAEVLYNGSPAGYTLDPQENIVYISKHDNETLWDILVYKELDYATTADLGRMQNVGLSIVGFSQGVPFFHAGSDMLRSKSLDRDSYNSGDWFNRLDFSYQSNNFGVGLPVEDKNGERWDVIAPLLADENLRPTPDDIMNSVMHFREMLQIRYSSPLFHLQTAEDVQARLAFHNTGPDQIPGLIVMSLSDSGDLEDIDADHEMIVVVFNARPEEVSFSNGDLAGMGFTLHPVQQSSNDPIVQTASFDDASGSFTVPARTTAVFVVTEN